MTDTLIDEIRAAADKLEKLRQEQREIAKKLFNESFQSIFETYPVVKSVKWTQYTPYFNDGDTCEFGVHEWAIHETISDDNSSYEHSESFYKKCNKQNHRWDRDTRTSLYIDNPDYDPTYGEAAKVIEALHRSMDQDVMKELFGDHVEVTVTEDGIEVEDYQHE